MKVPNLADARKLNLFPSVTTILKILHKPELQNWIVEQAVLAVLTTPRLKDEPDDAYVHRVLHVEKVQDQERDVAADKGKAIHEAIEDYFLGKGFDRKWQPWIEPACLALAKYGERVTSEIPIACDGFAGRLDLVQRTGDAWWIWDYKASKTLPDPEKGGAWKDHRLQLAAYAFAWWKTLQPQAPIQSVRVANVYISTVECGKFVICEHGDWWPAWLAFDHAMMVWRWQNNYLL